VNPVPVAIIKQAAQLACKDIYDPVDDGVFDKVYRVGETTCGTKRVGNLVYVVNQGTENRAGWIADFDLYPYDHPILGDLHTGFYKNLPELAKQLLADLPVGAQVVVTGHSKGAGEASIFGPLLKLSGVNVSAMVLFACPHAGCQMLADWIAKNIPAAVSYRNAPTGDEFFGDPVPMVPSLPYVAPVPLTYVDQPPGGLLDAVDVEWHLGKLYLAAAPAMIGD